MKRKKDMNPKQARNIRKGQIIRCINYLAYLTSCTDLVNTEQSVINSCKQELETLITDWENSNADYS